MFFCLTKQVHLYSRYNQAFCVKYYGFPPIVRTEKEGVHSTTITTCSYFYDLVSHLLCCECKVLPMVEPIPQSVIYLVDKKLKIQCFTATGMQGDAVMLMQGDPAYMDSVLN